MHTFAEETWWMIFRRFIFQSIAVYAAMFALIYIVGQIIAKTVLIVFFYGRRLYRFVNGPGRNVAVLQPKSDENRLVENSGQGDIGNPKDEKDE